MQKEFTLKLLPSEAADETILKNYIARVDAINPEVIKGYHILRHSIDARGRTTWINLLVRAFINEPMQPRLFKEIDWKDVHAAEKRVIIIGAGPAGLFSALKCIEYGIKPIILERGKDVRARRRDLASINKQGEVNPESNYCFGEGGAGTYSDGKLYTRSSKRGDVQRILQILHQFGADERILYEAHPHIGTNKLPTIITTIREHILQCGGEVHFEQKVIDFVVKDNQLVTVKTANGVFWSAESFVLATGHSARDIFELLHQKQILIEAKPFALGVRIEHPQSIIDRCQYHLAPPTDKIGDSVRGAFLPPASYSLVQQVEGRGVFSFCMCPGGIIAPAATAQGEIVVNGWSPSKRNNPFANSGMVVEIKSNDLKALPGFEKITGISPAVLSSPLGMMYFQQYVERKAFAAGGGRLVAPAQRVEDFIQKKTSAGLPDCSYLPGITASDLYGVLPPFVADTLRGGLIAFGQKMRGYRTNDAVLVATESRTSSPVRIPRDPVKLSHPQIKNLYPCAEGAGYAGGIVSAAMDGENVVAQIAAVFKMQK